MSRFLVELTSEDLVAIYSGDHKSLEKRVPLADGIVFDLMHFYLASDIGAIFMAIDALGAVKLSPPSAIKVSQKLFELATRAEQIRTGDIERAHAETADIVIEDPEES